MIVKIFPPSAAFNAVNYNTGKVDRGKGELMKVANFGPLQSLGQLRPEDYKNYLQMIAALNKKISKPQFHATISAEGKAYDKAVLTDIAAQWMQAMGYGKQPYLIVFHSDTANNHVHIVSVRVDKEGKKINSDFEFKCAIRHLNRIIGIDEDKSAVEDLRKALGYRFSTKAQFFLVLEGIGYKIVDGQLVKFGRKLISLDAGQIKFSEPDNSRLAQLKEIFKKYPDAGLLKSKFGLELIFQGDKDKPYGYTVIDHAHKNVFKGGMIMPLKEFLGAEPVAEATVDEHPQHETIHINIAQDIDDEAVHGRKRRKKTKNQR